LYVPWCEKALYKYSSFPFLSFTAGVVVCLSVRLSVCHKSVFYLNG